MKTINKQIIPLEKDLSFELSRLNKIEAKKCIIFEIVTDPKLDKLTISDRLSIFNIWYNGAEMTEQLDKGYYELCSAIEKHQRNKEEFELKNKRGYDSLQSDSEWEMLQYQTCSWGMNLDIQSLSQWNIK